MPNEIKNEIQLEIAHVSLSTWLATRSFRSTTSTRQLSNDTRLVARLCNFNEPKPLAVYLNPDRQRHCAGILGEPGGACAMHGGDQPRAQGIVTGDNRRQPK
jgi:hypothetical protein